MSSRTFAYSRRLSGLEFVQDVPVRVDDEGDEVVSLPDGLQADRAIVMRAWTMGLRTGELLRLMRSSLGLQATELALLLRVTPETLSRWENDVRPAHEDAFALVALLVRDTLEGHQRTHRFLEAARSLPYVVRENGCVRDALPDQSDAHALFARLCEQERGKSYRLEQGERVIRERPAALGEAQETPASPP